MKNAMEKCGEAHVTANLAGAAEGRPCGVCVKMKLPDSRNNSGILDKSISIKVDLKRRIGEKIAAYLHNLQNRV